jgi:hypothetical protein
MDLIPLRIAASSGTLRGAPVAPFIAAGFTLLQRCVPLVRALSRRRSAILLPTGGAALTALAASDGRGALILDPAADPTVWLDQTNGAKVGAIFTLQSFVAEATALGLPLIILDDVPSSALVENRRIDLGSHFGLDLAGTLDDPLREEEFVCFYRKGAGAPESISHRALVDGARTLEPDPATPAILRELIYPLLAGRAV